MLAEMDQVHLYFDFEKLLFSTNIVCSVIQNQDQMELVYCNNYRLI